MIAVSAKAQTFDFTARQFRELYDRQLKADNGDTIRSCKSDRTAMICTFNDAQYQRSIQAFKELNLANGRFVLHSIVGITTDRKEKVMAIAVKGSRGDPAALFHFIGQVGSLFRALKPSLTTEETPKLMMQLGLMHGDDDPTIGEKKLIIEDFAAVECNNLPSWRSLDVACVISPRY
jgi:hypothetical protein